MKSAIKYILIGCGGALLAAAMILACTAGVSVRKTLTCERLEIAILDSISGLRQKVSCHPDHMRSGDGRMILIKERRSSWDF